MSTTTELLLLALLVTSLIFPRTVARIKSYIARSIQDCERGSSRPAGRALQRPRHQNRNNNHGRARTNQRTAGHPARFTGNAGGGPCSRCEFEHLQRRLGDIQRVLRTDARANQVPGGDQLRREAGVRPVGGRDQVPAHPI